MAVASRRRAAPTTAAFAGRAAAWAGLAVLVALAVAGFAAYRTEPSYDAIWSLVWAREAVGGALPSFDAYRAPTEHPLALFVSLVLLPVGDEAPRVLVALHLAAFVALLAGLVRLGRASLGLLAGVVAAGLLLTRLNYAFLAAFGFIDIPFLALLVWAAALEAERPRRGGIVLWLLGAAGLLRPEAWAFAALYAVWLLRAESGTGPAPARRAHKGSVPLLAVAAPAIWALTDLVVTGNPVFSFTYSTDHAAELGRDRGLPDLPRATLLSADEMLKWPVLLLALAGVAVALARREDRERARLPLVLALGGVVTFLVVSQQGFSVIPRYFATAAVGLFVFAGYALTGWARPGVARRTRGVWAAVALVAAVAGGVYGAATLNPRKVDSELRLRERVFGDLRALLEEPAVAAARRCGPVALPNHKLVPYARWHLGAGPDEVLARSDAEAAAEARRGVAIVVADVPGLRSHPAFGPIANPHDPRAIRLPPRGFRRIAARPRLSAWARC